MLGIEYVCERVKNKSKQSLVAKHFTFYECIKFSEQNLCLKQKNF